MLVAVEATDIQVSTYVVQGVFVVYGVVATLSLTSFGKIHNTPPFVSFVIIHPSLILLDTSNYTHLYNTKSYVGPAPCHTSYSG